MPGIEINTFFEDQEIHILGYYIDYENHDLRRLLLGLQNQREQRTFRIVENLKHFGLGISYDDVVAKATGSSIGRPHIALALMEKGYVDSVEEAFDRFLSVGKPGYIPRDKMSPFEAIDLIKKHSGIPVLAHPGLLEHQLVIDSLLDHGLLGIEVYHISHTAEQIAHYTQLAKDRKLLFTGGSDSHDCRTIGAIEVPQTVLEKLKEAKSQLDNL